MILVSLLIEYIYIYIIQQEKLISNKNNPFARLKKRRKRKENHEQ